jgi:hypothetical protein
MPATVTAGAVAGEAMGAGAELRRGATAVRVALDPGAPIAAFIHDGHDWCRGGPWQDYAPTRRACALPTFVAGAAGARFPDGGTLTTDEHAVEVRADQHGNISSVNWRGSAYPLDWARTIALDAGGALTIRYAVSNTQRAPLPFVWGIPLTLPWSEQLAIDLPRGSRARVAESIGDGLAPQGSEFAWPALRDGGHLVDLSRPASLAPGRAVLCYVELPRARFGVRTPHGVLDVRGDPGAVTHARVWITNGVDAPGSSARRWWQRRAASPSLSIGPTVGAPDVLSEAVGGWGSARWIEPGDTVRWNISVRVLPLEE